MKAPRDDLKPLSDSQIFARQMSEKRQAASVHNSGLRASFLVCLSFQKILTV